MTNREEFLLWKYLEPKIRYYLTHYNSAIRAATHINLSKAICYYVLSEVYSDRSLKEYPPGWSEVHDWIAHHISDNLDNTINYHGVLKNHHIRLFYELILEGLEELTSIIKNCDERQYWIFHGTDGVEANLVEASV